MHCQQRAGEMYLRSMQAKRAASSTPFSSQPTATFEELLLTLRCLAIPPLDSHSKCLLAHLFQKVDNKPRMADIRRQIAKEISGYEALEKSTRRREHVLICSLYRLLAVNKPLPTRQENQVKAHLAYAENSKDWLGYPEIACVIALLEKRYTAAAQKAQEYLAANFQTWIAQRRARFVALAVIGAYQRLPNTSLQSVVEFFEEELNAGHWAIADLSLFLIALSRTAIAADRKEAAIERVYRVLERDLMQLLDPTSALPALRGLFCLLEANSPRETIAEFVKTYNRALSREGYRLELRDGNIQVHIDAREGHTQSLSVSVGDLALAALAIRAVGYHETFGSVKAYSHRLEELVAKSREVETEQKWTRLTNVAILILTGLVILLGYFLFQSVERLESWKSWWLGVGLLVLLYEAIGWLMWRSPLMGVGHWLKEKLPILGAREKKNER